MRPRLVYLAIAYPSAVPLARKQGWRRTRPMDTVNVTIDLPRGILSALKQDPDGFVQEMRLAAAIKWYEMERVSQAKAAEIAGLSRAEFLDALARFGVTPFQYRADDVIREAGSA